MIARNPALAVDYDTVELRTGRLRKIHVSEARAVGEEDRSVEVVKCYCRSQDVLTAAEAEQQSRPSFVFPVRYFTDLETLIGKELEGRIYSNTQERRVRFLLDLKEHAGFQLAGDGHILESPWYDERVLNE